MSYVGLYIKGKLVLLRDKKIKLVIFHKIRDQSSLTVKFLLSHSLQVVLYQSDAFI